VGGDLDISGGDALASLAGLESLVAVGGRLSLWNEGAVRPLDFSRLNALQWVGGDLQIWRPERGTAISGLRALRSVGGSFYMNEADGLTELVAFPSLTCILGNIDFETMWTPANANLTRIALPGLSYVGGIVVIENQPALQQISLFDTVQTIAGGEIR